MTQWSLEVARPPGATPDDELPLSPPRSGLAFVASGAASLAELRSGALVPLGRPGGRAVDVAARDGRVVVLERSDATLVGTHGEVVDDPELGLVLDGRLGTAAVHLRSPSGDELFVVERNLLRRYQLALPAPAPLELVGELERVEPWLRERMATLERADTAYGRAIVAGTWGRCWSPLDRAGALKQLLAGEGSPVDRAGAWAEGLPPGIREVLLREARSAIASAAGALEDLRADAVEGDVAAIRRRWDHLVEVREALACVAWVLLRAGDDRVEAELRALDRRVEARGSERPPPGPRARWQEVVRVGEPGAWWADG
jgi:hypothetical protein